MISISPFFLRYYLFVSSLKQIKIVLVFKTDKIYLSTPTKIAILDHEKKRTFVVRKDGLADAGKKLENPIFIYKTIL